MARSKNVFQRASKAQERQESVLDLFRTAAAALEEVAAEHRDVANEASVIADAHKSQAGSSVQKAVEAEQAAVRLRELVG